MDRDRIIAALTQRLASEVEIVAAWLFGSVARSQHREASDVDVAVLGGPAPRTLADLPLDLAAELSAAIGREVQIVRLESAPADLIHRVLRDGVLLVDRDRAARIRFEVDARNRYFDMRPVWLEYRAGRASEA